MQDLSHLVSCPFTGGPFTGDINVVPVQEGDEGPIENIEESSRIPPLDIKPDVKQGD